MKKKYYLLLDGCNKYYNQYIFLFENVLNFGTPLFTVYREDKIFKSLPESYYIAEILNKNDSYTATRYNLNKIFVMNVKKITDIAVWDNDAECAIAIQIDKRNLKFIINKHDEFYINILKYDIELIKFINKKSLNILRQFTELSKGILSYHKRITYISKFMSKIPDS